MAAKFNVKIEAFLYFHLFSLISKVICIATYRTKFILCFTFLSHVFS